jgi:hypothetical protein
MVKLRSLQHYLSGFLPGGWRGLVIPQMIQGGISPLNLRFFRNFFFFFKFNNFKCNLRHLEAELSILWCLKLIRGIISTLKKMLFKIFFYPHQIHFWRKPCLYIQRLSKLRWGEVGKPLTTCWEWIRSQSITHEYLKDKTLPAIIVLMPFFSVGVLTISSIMSRICRTRVVGDCV